MEPGSEVDALVRALGLEPHPEGGWYRRAWTHPDTDAGDRPLASSIHYLLAAGQRSHWHRIDAAESWLWHAGGPLVLSTAAREGAPITDTLLGPDVGEGQQLLATVPAATWQSAAPAPGATHVLVSCVVVPAFTFAGFELAPPGWSPT